MVEKRFIVDGNMVRDVNGEIPTILTHDTTQLNEFLDGLNNLHKENERLKKQLLENNCDNCKYSKAIYADVECRKKGLTEWKFNCDEFNGDLE